MAPSVTAAGSCAPGSWRTVDPYAAVIAIHALTACIMVITHTIARSPAAVEAELQCGLNRFAAPKGMHARERRLRGIGSVNSPLRAMAAAPLHAVAAHSRRYGPFR